MSPMAARTRHRKPRRGPNLELQALRVNRGLSRQDLAYLTGVSRESIRLYEEQGFTPGPRIQFLLARAFDKAPTDIWPLDRMVAAA